MTETSKNIADKVKECMTKCKQAKFVQIVKPGQTVEYESELLQSKGNSYEFLGKVMQGGQVVASAKFLLESKTLSDFTPKFNGLEDPINVKYKKIFETLTR